MPIQTVGFIGLGAMGTPMAWNVSDVYDLCVHNRTRARTTPFADEGVPVRDSPRDVASAADAVVVMVTGPDALLDVLGGDEGVVAGVDENTTVINMSTVSREATERAAEMVWDAGGQFVDSPVSGTIPHAESQALTVLAAGADDVLDEVRPLLETMGNPVIDCGDVGQGTDTKLTVNLLLGDMMQSFAEALVFGAEQGLDFEVMLEAITSGGLDAPLFGAKADAIESGDFEPMFPVELLFKDLNLVMDAAAETETPLPATAATREAVNATRALGHGEEDMAAVIRHLETVAGTEVGERD